MFNRLSLKIKTTIDFLCSKRNSSFLTRFINIKLISLLESSNAIIMWLLIIISIYIDLTMLNRLVVLSIFVRARYSRRRTTLETLIITKSFALNFSLKLSIILSIRFSIVTTWVKTIKHFSFLINRNNLKFNIQYYHKYSRRLSSGAHYIFFEFSS